MQPMEEMKSDYEEEDCDYNPGKIVDNNYDVNDDDDALYDDEISYVEGDKAKTNTNKLILYYNIEKG